MMKDIPCPSCGTRSRHESIEESAESFCTTCDYPLFWSSEHLSAGLPATAKPPPPVAGRMPDHVRRQAGVAGIKRRSTIACPNCSELNLQVRDKDLRSEARCLRCDELLFPAPGDVSEGESERHEEPANEEPVEPAAPFEDDRTWLLMVLIGGAIIAILIVSVVIAAN